MALAVWITAVKDDCIKEILVIW